MNEMEKTAMTSPTKLTDGEILRFVILALAIMLLCLFFARGAGASPFGPMEILPSEADPGEAIGMPPPGEPAVSLTAYQALLDELHIERRFRFTLQDENDFLVESIRRTNRYLDEERREHYMAMEQLEGRLASLAVRQPRRQALPGHKTPNGTD